MTSCGGYQRSRIANPSSRPSKASVARRSRAFFTHAQKRSAKADARFRIGVRGVVLLSGLRSSSRRWAALTTLPTGSSQPSFSSKPPAVSSPSDALPGFSPAVATSVRPERER